MGKFSKDKRDIYYRRAKESGYRARSAFKLLQIAAHFNIFDGVTRVVDLCAAPGGWTEVLSEVLGGKGRKVDETAEKTVEPATSDPSSSTEAVASTNATSLAASSPSPPPDVKIIAVDLQAMSPLPCVHFIQGDLTRASTATLIREALGFESDGTTPSLAQLVVCDGAPDVIGMHDVDESIQYSLLLSALGISLRILTPNGTFIAKIFRGRDVDKMYGLMQRYFDRVTISKPKACRNSSVEAFVVCQGFRGVDAVAANSSSSAASSTDINSNDTITLSYDSSCTLREPVRFVSCWDEEMLDSDRSYPLSFQFKNVKLQDRTSEANESAASTDTSSASSAAASSSTYQNRAPSAMPIDPPYKRSLQMKKQNLFQKQ